MAICSPTPVCACRQIIAPMLSPRVRYNTADPESIKQNVATVCFERTNWKQWIFWLGFLFNWWQGCYVLKILSHCNQKIHSMIHHNRNVSKIKKAFHGPYIHIWLPQQRRVVLHLYLRRCFPFTTRFLQGSMNTKFRNSEFLRSSRVRAWLQQTSSRKARA